MALVLGVFVCRCLSLCPSFSCLCFVSALGSGLTLPFALSVSSSLFMWQTRRFYSCGCLEIGDASSDHSGMGAER